MPKKPPTLENIGTQTFPTKQEAEAWAKEFRKEKTKQGFNIRYEIDLIKHSGEFRVRTFTYAEDAKGNLI